MKALFDTNILVDYLNGIAAARDEIRLHQRPMISLITWMEVLAGTRADQAALVRAFLRRFECVGIDARIAERAVQVRRTDRLKLPDAIIRATALESRSGHSRLLSWSSSDPANASQRRCPAVGIYSPRQPNAESH